MRFLEDIEIGHRRTFGSFTFTAESIKTFARQFDPQPFHLDEEAGRKSLFGGLAASGCHITAVGMKLLAARGEPVATWGPSPGFRELRWLKPVMAGDTITYGNQVESVRATATRPGWGIVTARNTSTNQHGEVVMTFLAIAFVPQRPAVR